MKRLPLVWLIAMAVLVSLVRPATANPPLADRLPPGIVAYLGLAGKTPALEKTQFMRMLNEPAIEEAMSAIAKAIRSSAPADDQAKVDKLFALLDIVLTKPMALALLDVGGKDTVSLALLVDLGADKPAFERQFNEFLADVNVRLQPAETAGRSYQIAAVGPVALSTGYSGNVLFLHVGSQLEKLLAVTPETSLKADKAFAAKYARVDGADVQAAFYADIARLTAAVKQFLPMDEQVGKMTEALGVAQITATAWSLRVTDGDFHSRGMLFSPAPHQGLLKIFAGKPIVEADLAGLTASAEVAAVAKLSPSELYREVRATAKRINPEFEDALDGYQAVFQQTLGVSLVGQLLPSMGDTWVLSSDSRQGGLLTGTMLSVSLKDPAKFSDALGKIEAFLAKQMGGAEGGAPAAGPAGIIRGVPAIRTFLAGKTAIRYVTLPGEEFPLAPAWAVHDGRFYLAAWPQVIAAAVNPPAGAAPKPLTNEPAFRRLRSKLSEQPVMLSYVDWPRVLREVYPAILAVWTAVCNNAEFPLPLRADWLPTPAVLESYFGPEMNAVTPLEDGILFEHAGTMPSGGPLMSALGTGTVVAVALPALNQARNRAKETACGMNLSMLGKAIAMHRAEFRDQPPKDLQVVLKQGYLSKEALQCPRAKAGREIDYLYLPLGENAPADAITACDLKGNHGDSRNVLRNDGSVQTMTEEEFQAELAKPANAKLADALKRTEGAPAPAPQEQ